MSTLILIERVNNIYTTTQLGIKKPSRYEGKKVLIAAAAFGQEKEKGYVREIRDYVMACRRVVNASRARAKRVTKRRYTGSRYR